MSRIREMSLLASAFVLASGLAHAGSHTVIKTYVVSGDPMSQLQEGANSIHTMNVSCPRNLAACTLVLNAMDQVCENNGVGIIPFSIIVSVDGTAVGAGADGGTGSQACGALSWLGNVQVGPGRHKIDLSTIIPIQPDSETLQHNWSVNYAVTSP